MLKRVLCLVIISSLLSTDIVYPLNNSTSLRDRGFRQAASRLASVLSFVRHYPKNDLREIRMLFNVNINKDDSGVWLDDGNWKIRFFEPARTGVPNLDKDDELVYEEELNGRLKVQIYFKGLEEEAKQVIRGFLFNNPNVSRLAKMVLKEIIGESGPPSGRIVRRALAKEEDEKLSGFIKGLPLQISYTEAAEKAIREAEVKRVDKKTKDAVRDYVGIFTKRMKLREGRDSALRDKELFIFKKLSELEDEKIYKSLIKLFTGIIGRNKRLKVVPPNVIARVMARHEGLMERDVDPTDTISFTWGDTIYFNSDSRLSDFIVYILHEVAHLYGGNEKDALRMDKEIIGVLKGVVNLLRTEKQESIADVLEYEVLGYELNLHTARLKGTSPGEAFLRHFKLAGIDLTAQDVAGVTGVIKEKKDGELFSEIRSIIKRKDKRFGIRLFWAFMKYVKRKITEKVEKEIELEEEEEEKEEAGPLEPLYEKDVLNYIIVKDEAERRLREVVLNPDAPLFARINDAIMIDMFSETQKLELDAVDKIRSVLEREPIKALQILEELRNAKSVELVSGFLKHEDPGVRRMAAKVLLNIVRALVPNSVFNSQVTMKNLLGFINRPVIDIKDEDLTAFLQIVTVLSGIRCREAIPIFIDIVEKNKSNRIRIIVARALGSIGDTSIIPVIRDRIWRKGDKDSLAISIACLEQVPNDEAARIVIETFQKAGDKKLKSLCLKILESMIRKRRISTVVVEPILGELAGMNFMRGRIASIAAQEGKELNIKIEASGSEDFAKGFMHDTFTNISDMPSVLRRHVGKWFELIEYMQKLRDNIYKGEKVYDDLIWKDVAVKMAEVKPEKDKVIGKLWFQRMCMAICYRVLLDTWDIGRIEDRDFILELMILRTNFVSDEELPDAVGATEAIHGEYVDLDESLFSTPADIPNGVDTVWHEATHLVSSMGIADIGDISLLGASSHSNIEFYLLSEIFGLPSISEVVDDLKNGKTIDQLRDKYAGKGISGENFECIAPILEGMAVRDKTEGPLEAFLMVRNINPKKARKWKWEDVVWRLRKINTEIVDTFTIRGKKQILVHTYKEGARFSGYANRLGVETGFYNAANIYLELIVKTGLTPAQAEFIARVIARFMTEEKDYIKKMKTNIKGAPIGEIEKWLRRFIVERIKFLALKPSADIEMWITYDELEDRVNGAYKIIRAKMEKRDVQKDICDKAIKAIGTRKRIFKAVRRGYERGDAPKQAAHIEDVEGILRPIGVYRLEKQRYVEVCIDFGLGEESFAYVDTETKKIRFVNPEDRRVDVSKIAEVLDIELTKDDNLGIESPLERKEISFRSMLKRIRNAIIAIYKIIVSEIKKRIEFFYEDIKVSLTREVRRQLRETRTINKGIRRFIESIRKDLFSIDELNSILLTYDRGWAINTLARDWRLHTNVARRIVDHGLRVLEYKEEVAVRDLEDIELKPDLERAILAIINGRYVYPVLGRISLQSGVEGILKFKRIGLGECFEYAKEGRDRLFKVLRNSLVFGYVRRWRLSIFTAEELTEHIYNIYLSLKEGEGLNEFIDKVIQMDLSRYITPPTQRHNFINIFNTSGIESITNFIKAQVREIREGAEYRERGIVMIGDRVKNAIGAVLDSMGVDKGLEFLRKIKNETEDRVLKFTLAVYIDYFEIGPDVYIPVEILDSWQSFKLWEERAGEVNYEDVQRRFIELYMRYIKGAKGNIPRWGWTFLWLGYFEKGERMYNAVKDLLNIVVRGEDIDIEGLCKKYKLTGIERQQLVNAMPIDGLIELLGIYCKGIVWGTVGLVELEEKLKGAMNIVTRSDIEKEDLFNKDVDAWLYTFRNAPSGLKEKTKDEVIGLIMARLEEIGSAVPQRKDLERLFDLLFTVTLPANGERLVDNISVVEVCKILFDYARAKANNDVALRKRHFEKNKGLRPSSLYLPEWERVLGGSNRLLIFTHKHTDSISLLYWVQDLFKMVPGIEVKIIPQKSMWEPNSTKEDIEALLGESELQELAEQKVFGNFVILDDASPGLSWLKGPECQRIKEEIDKAGVVLGIGWDNFVSLQGLNKPCYFSFSIDDEIKASLTGCAVGEHVFEKTYGGLLASKIGSYRLKEYLSSVSSGNHTDLLDLFCGDNERLHEWIRKEAKRTEKREVDIMTDPVSKDELINCALRDIDPEVRTQALDLLLNNHEGFGGVKIGWKGTIKIGGLDIEIDSEMGCCYLNKSSAVLVKGDKRLILEVFDEKFLRIGEKIYNVMGVVNLEDIMGEPSLWVGNSELVEFMGTDSIELEGLEPPRVEMKDIPQEFIKKVPLTRPGYIYGIAERFLNNPNLPLKLHYVYVLLSSPDISQKQKALEELDRLIASGDPVILEIIKQRGLNRVGEWVSAEVPSVDRDIFSLTNFTTEQEKVIRVLCGGYILRPLLVAMPGQGISARFFSSVHDEISRFGISLVKGNYAGGAGSVLLHDGTRQHVKEGDSLIELSRDLPQGQMLGAIRFKKGEERIVQIPTNSGILNYLKVVHHLAHVVAERFTEVRTRKAEPFQEFTPTIEDILVIKYMERISGSLKDGFGDFKEEIRKARGEGDLREIFRRYGLNYTPNVEEILKLESMAEFAEYIERNNLGSFISIKEFLNVLTGYLRNAIKDYIRQLPYNQQFILERLLTAGTDDEINSLILVASLLAGCHIPKIKFDEDIKLLSEYLTRPEKVAISDKTAIFKRIDDMLESGEPFSAKAVKIVGNILHRTGIRVSFSERREIEEEVMDVLSGKWLQRMNEMLQERLRGMEERKMAGTKELREMLEEVKSYMIGESQKLGKAEQVEVRDEDIEQIDSWNKVVDYARKNNIKRVFCDIDKTILDAPGFITTTPWFRELAAREGEEEAARQWRELEERIMKMGMIHLMEDTIPKVLQELRDMGVEVILYTARAEIDIPRTQEMLKGLGIEGLEIITSGGGAPEVKRAGLIRYYDGKGWFGAEEIPSLYIDDTLATLKAVHGDSRFRHISCIWYHPPYQKRYDVNPEAFLEEGDKALAAGRIMEALQWYYEAFYVRSRKDIVNQVYDIVLSHIGFDAVIENIFYRFIKKRFDRYGGALERENVWIEARKARQAEAKPPERKEISWYKGAPDVKTPSFWKGVKRIIVIGSHPHGDHVKGFLDYAKRKLRVLYPARIPEPFEMRTGGPITHSLSNYWGRIGEETIVIFDLGWFPEGFVDPIIQTIAPEDLEILFITDPSTERTIDFKRQLGKAGVKNVKFETLPYDKILGIPIEKGRVLQIENSPAYHLPLEVGSSVYLTRVLDAETQEEAYSVGYISELGDLFPEEIDHELLGKISSLKRGIFDGTNLIAKKGDEPLPIKGRPNKIYRFVKLLNRGSFLIAHFNTTSIKMVEEAQIAARDLDPGIPIVIIGGKDAIDELKRSYNVPKDSDFYTFGDRKIYLVHDVAAFHKKLRGSSELPKLEYVLDKRKEELRKAGWTKKEIDDFVSEWMAKDKQEIEEQKGPEGRAREIDLLLWDLRKTKAVVIGSSQFRGDPKKQRYQNFKGFQILDAIVDKKDVCILIEGRLHPEGEEGTVLRVLFDKKKDREIDSITGKKKVRATVDSQWMSGHITFEQLVFLLNCVADEAEKMGNVYDIRTYIPVPMDEWFSLIPGDEAISLLQKHGKGEIRDVIDIINRWNDRKDVTEDEIHFAREVMKTIFESFSSYPEDLKKDLIRRLDMAERDIRLRGKVNVEIFIASISKFLDVLNKDLEMDPEKLAALLKVANRFIGFELGVSYRQGKTIDLVKRRTVEYSEDLERKLNREYLKELYRGIEEGEIHLDLSRIKEGKGLEEYRAELKKLLEDAKRKAERQGGELFVRWSWDMKRYIETQFLKLGFRYIDKFMTSDELRREISVFYDAVIEHVYNYIQEDTGGKYKDMAIVCGGDYALMKTLFKDTVKLDIIAGDEVELVGVNRLQNRMRGILDKLGIPVEFSDWQEFFNRRVITSGTKTLEKQLKQPVRKDILTKRKKRFDSDNEILESKKGFDIHTGPGGLDDIELVRYFFSAVLTEDEKGELDRIEEFLRRYKEEAGLSTGGDREKAKVLIGEVMYNLDPSKTPGQFMDEFYKRVKHSYSILRRVTARTRTGVKNLSFGLVDEQRDIHEGTFEKAAMEGRIRTDHELLRSVIRGYPALEGREYKIIKEEPGKPTMFYRDEPFASVLSHSGRRTNTIYVGLNTLRLVEERPEYRNALFQLLLHENRDIERGYHMDLEDEVKERFLEHSDVDEIYRLWNNLITNGRFGKMYYLYMERAKEEKYWEYFLKKIPADIRLIKGSDSFEFRHGDSQNLPDFIGLNLRLFGDTFSPETQVFLLRHCTDRIRNPRYETIIHDIKYLLTVAPEEKKKILLDLYRINSLGMSRYFEWGDHIGKGDFHAYIKFLENILKECKPDTELTAAIKEKIREYTGLRFDTYTSPDGADIWYSVGGNPNARRTLVFLHGVGVNSRDWRHQITFFEEDYRIVTIDLRGFGKSEGLGALPPHIRNYSKDVEGVLTQEDIDDAVLVGHSMGGMVILNMDEIYGDKPMEERRIKGIVLISTTAGKPTESFFFPWLKEIGFEQLIKILLNMLRFVEFAWDSKVFRWIVKRSVPTSLVQEIFERFIIQRETHPLFTRKVTRSVFANNLEDLIYGFLSILKHDVSARLKDLNIPALWLVGMGDRIVLPREQFNDAGQIKGCKAVPIPKASHYPHVRYPRRANKAISRFINTGTYRFSQKVTEKIRERFQVDISLDELEAGLGSLKIRLVPRLNGDATELRLIDEISRIIMSCGEETEVSNELMIKAVMIVASQVIPKPSVVIPPARPISEESIEDIYQRYIVQSV